MLMRVLIGRTLMRTPILRVPMRISICRSIYMGSH
jgi:hypothetical protein